MSLPVECPRHLAGFLLGMTVLGVIPFLGATYVTVVALQLLMFMALAASWNLITGFTGYLSFGHVAYFGVGAYTAALLVTRIGSAWVSAVFAGGLAAAGLALLVGAVCLRLRGHYFSIATFGLNEIVRIAVLLADPWTRGAMGISLPPGSSVTVAYYAMAGLAAFVVILTYAVVNSRLGLRLIAIREDEDAARAYGIPTVRYKVAAFVVSAFFPGVVGGVYAHYIGYIAPESVFAPLISIQMIVFVLFGGKGTVLGPVVGTVSLFLLWELLWVKFPFAHLTLFGLLITVVVLLMPAGIIGALSGTRLQALDLKIPVRARLLHPSHS